MSACGLVRPNALKFDHTPAEITEITSKVIEESQKTIDDVVALNASRTFKNSILPIVKLEAQISTMASNLTFYRYVATCKDLRQQSLVAEE